MFLCLPYLSNKKSTDSHHKQDVEHCWSHDRSNPNISLCNKYTWNNSKHLQVSKLVLFIAGQISLAEGGPF